MRALSVVILAVCFLAGCAHPLQYQPTMASDPPRIGIEGLVLINELGKAYVRPAPAATSICEETLPSFQEREEYTYWRFYRGSKTKTEDIFKCVFFKERGKNDSTDVWQAGIRHHILTGFALTDLYCDTFFQRIARHSGKRHFARNTVNDVGTAIGTILGLASAGSAATSAVNAVTGLSDASFRAYDAEFLVANDLPGLQRLVHAAQDRYRSEVLEAKGPEAKAVPDTYAEASMIIWRYANYCSFVGMRGLISESIDKNSNPSSKPGEPSSQTAKPDASAPAAPPAKGAPAQAQRHAAAQPNEHKRERRAPGARAGR